jgi:hypothetical protein
MMTAAAAAALCAAFVTGGGAAAGTAAPAAAATARAGTWGTAKEIPGTGRLNAAKRDTVGAISCADSSDCSAGGSYASAFGTVGPVTQAFVVNKTAGKWQTAQEVPGTATLNAGGGASLNALSCAAAGSCSGGGTYTDSASHRQAFVVSETGGTWGTAQELPGTAALNKGNPGAEVTAISCPTVGNCVAAGRYADGSSHSQVFVATETNGTWGNAQEIPGTGALNAGGYATVGTLSCPTVGNCSVGGLYASQTIDHISNTQAFVASETNGTWGTALEVPGTAALNSGGYAEVISVSCATAGNCSAGGWYTDSTATQAFVVNETNGTWGTAATVPGLAALNTGGLAQISAIQCGSPGNCSAGGIYLDSTFNNQPFLVTETGGTWGSAAGVPGISALEQGIPGASIGALACDAVGDCSAGGFYADSSSHRQAYVVSETGGTWGTAEEVPGSATLNAGGQAAIGAMACAPGGLCSAVGGYTDASNNHEVFAVNQS